MSFNQCLGMLLFVCAGSVLVLLALLWLLEAFGWPILIGFLLIAFGGGILIAARG